MLEIIGYILILSLFFLLIKLFFSIIIGFFLCTIFAFFSVGAISALLAILRIVEPDTAWIIVQWATGIGFFFDVIRFIKSPGKVFSIVKDNFTTPIDLENSSRTESSRGDADYRYRGDSYRKCCGSCKWLSGNSSHYDMCTLHGRETSHSDCCGDWQ